jgi:hypothetical protein
MKSSYGNNSYPIQIKQQKLMPNGSLWVVVSCGYCEGKARLDREGAAKLCWRLRNELIPSGYPVTSQKNWRDSQRPYFRKIIRRIWEGYKVEPKIKRTAIAV